MSPRLKSILGLCLAACFAAVLALWWARESASSPLARVTGPVAVAAAAITPAPASDGNNPSDSAPSSNPLPPPQRASSGPTAAPAVVASSATSAGGTPGPTLTDILEQAGDLGDPANRARVVEQMRAVENEQRSAARERAHRLGLPIRVERPDGTVQELAAFEGDQPVYLTTHNLNAAISTGASVLRASTYNLTGAGLTIGVWDGGAARTTHQEFGGSRVTVKDGATAIDHATHVAGTIAAAGVVASARGMASSVHVDSYEWTNDITEMTSRAATAPNQAGMIYLSNHSYGYVSGWNYVGGTGTPARTWEWNGTSDGTGSTAFDSDFGRYNTYSSQSDALAFSAPYYLMFRSAGNDRVDNPAQGDAVALTPGSSTVAGYDSALHPAGDSGYRGGFDTLGFDALAKNVLTVGSTADAVTNGVRDVAKAAMSSFSSWGPTDDGRIKPDLVANGDALYSSLNGGDASYGTYSGTSMATPNALGTTVLLIEEYARLFPGGAMRSSTLKGLLIHTADDRGNVGPDYKYGWGLLNGQAAVDLLRDHAANPLKLRLTEDTISTSRTSVTYTFVWDGSSPLRATLCWTDPNGTATTTSDLRTPRLINNLDLKILDSNGTEYLPYVMPFVGTWTQASMDLPATTGRNTTDNVEQVYLAAPPVAGTYRCVVTYVGTLKNNTQNYALLLSGAANEAPPLSVTGITPASALQGTVLVTVSGSGLQAGATVKLQRAGSSDITATNVQRVNDTLTAWVNLAGAAAGLWDVVVTNPGGEAATLTAAFTVTPSVWTESFDGTVSGWASEVTTGTNAWAVTTAQAHTPASSYFAPGPATISTCNLTSPAFSVPAGATGLQFKFWHRYDLQSARDGGRLEFSIDGGSWFDVTATGSGAAFASNGYTATITTSSRGKPVAPGEFIGLAAWTGNSGGFIETIVNLDSTKYAGKTLRARWRLATDGGTASAGWYVDTISLVGGGDLSNHAPVITTAAKSASTTTVTDPDGTVFEIVSGRSIGLSVAASDDTGEAALTYTWSATSAGGVPVFFSPNSSNAAKATVASFESTGDYFITVTVRDAQGLATSSVANIRVSPTADSLSVSPAAASVTVGAQQTFTATLLDQFGAAMPSQPPSFGWSVSGGGTVNTSGVFSAATAGGPYTLTATYGGFSALASVTVNKATAAVTLSNLTQTYDGSAKPITVVTTPAGLTVSVTYAGSAVVPGAVGSYPVEAVVVSANYQGSATGTLVIQPRRYTLTVTASPTTGGTVTGGGTFDEGTAAPVAATVTDGWRFTGWTGAGLADAASPATTVTMDATRTVTATFVQLTAFEVWTQSNALQGSSADPLADPDGDGIPNLLEYATGTSPGSAGGPVVGLGQSGGALTLSFPRIADPALTYTVEATDDLGGTWTPIAVSTGGSNVAGTVTVTDTVNLSTHPRRFLRLRVEAATAP